MTQLLTQDLSIINVIICQAKEPYASYTVYSGRVTN